MLLLFSSIAMSLSCVALGVALWCWSRVRRALHGASLKSQAALSSEVSELLSSFESMQLTIRRLSARVGMADLRARKAQLADENNVNESVGEKPGVGREKLREIARARGFKLT